MIITEDRLIVEFCDWLLIKDASVGLIPVNLTLFKVRFELSYCISKPVCLVVVFCVVSLKSIVDIFNSLLLEDEAPWIVSEPIKVGRSFVSVYVNWELFVVNDFSYWASVTGFISSIFDHFSSTSHPTFITLSENTTFTK